MGASFLNATVSRYGSFVSSNSSRFFMQQFHVIQLRSFNATIHVVRASFRHATISRYRSFVSPIQQHMFLQCNNGESFVSSMSLRCHIHFFQTKRRMLYTAVRGLFFTVLNPPLLSSGIIIFWFLEDF